MIDRKSKKKTMDYKYIEQLLERYWQAETSLEEERILRAFFAQEQLPADMERLRPLFSYDADMEQPSLGDDFDSRLMAQLGPEASEAFRPQQVKAVEVSLSQRLMPLFKAAAVVAIILTVGGALQAPWDSSWNDTPGMAQQQVDSVTMVRPVQADNASVPSVDSTNVMVPVRAKD